MGLGAEPPALDDFYDFSIKMTYFQACLGFKTYSSFKTYSDDS